MPGEQTLTKSASAAIYCCDMLCMFVLDPVVWEWKARDQQCRRTITVAMALSWVMLPWSLREAGAPSSNLLLTQECPITTSSTCSAVSRSPARTCSRRRMKSLADCCRKEVAELQGLRLMSSKPKFGSSSAQWVSLVAFQP